MAVTANQRICIVVLGMHRSGTSALTRVLSLLGADLPANVMGPGEANLAGHWEPDRLVRIHDQMLEEAGSRWDDWRAFDLSALPGDRLQAYRTAIVDCLRDEYGEAPLFVLKDPRVARFVPLYAEILASLDIEAHYALCLRNPRAVTTSLIARDGSTPGSAMLLWLRHVLDAEIATRHSERCIASYEDLMADWRKVVSSITESLDIRWPRDVQAVASSIDSFLAPDLRHHDAGAEELRDRIETAGWVRAVHDAMTSLIRDPLATGALETLDRVRGEFYSASEIFGAATFPELLARERRVLEIDQERWRELQRAEAAEAALVAIQNSRSWRITAPIRAARSRIGRLENQRP